MGKIIFKDKFMAALSYIQVLVLIPLAAVFVFKYKSKFVKFHAIQGAILFITGGLWPWLFFVPKIGGFLLAIQIPGMIIFFVIVFSQVFRGKFLAVPFIEQHILKYKGKIRFVLFLAKELREARK